MSPAPPRRWGWLLPLLSVAACARQEAPSGGQIDRIPPVVVAVTPEALSEVEPGGETIRIQFNERISERLAGGTLNDAVTVSPRTGDVNVEHSRSSLEVEVLGGFQPGVVYRVTVRPVVRDMFNNTMREPFEFGFSTGGEFHETALAGLVVDRVTGRPLHDIVVRAVGERGAAPDSVVHLARTDSGVYTMRWLPPGPYRVVAFQDRNRDFAVDPMEPQGLRDLALGPADTVFLDFPVIEPDTTPARLTRAEVVDSATVRLTFDDYLDPDVSLARVGASLEAQGGDPPASLPEVRQLLHEHRYRAILAARDSVARAADSLLTAGDSLPPNTASDTLVADTLVADTLAADSLGPGDSPAAARAARGAAGMYVGRAQGADSASAALLGLTLPSRVVYAELSDSLPFGVPLVLRMEGVVNLAGLASAIDSARVTREPPPPPPPGLEARARPNRASGGGGASPERPALPPRRVGRARFPP